MSLTYYFLLLRRFCFATHIFPSLFLMGFATNFLITLVTNGTNFASASLSSKCFELSTMTKFLLNKFWKAPRFFCTSLQLLANKSSGKTLSISLFLDFFISLYLYTFISLFLISWFLYFFTSLFMCCFIACFLYFFLWFCVSFIWNLGTICSASVSVLSWYWHEVNSMRVRSDNILRCDL